MSIHRWMNKDVVHTHAHTQWNIIQPFKKVEIMPFAATWMETEIVILNEESQMVHAPPPGKPSKTEKDKYHTLRWHSGTEPTGQCRRCRRGGLIPGSGKSPGSGNGNPLQSPYLKNSMDRRAWRATAHGVTKSQTGLSTRTHTHIHCLYVGPF